jgi:hypothetical protein
MQLLSTHLYYYYSIMQLASYLNQNSCIIAILVIVILAQCLQNHSLYEENSFLRDSWSPVSINDRQNVNTPMQEHGDEIGFIEMESLSSHSSNGMKANRHLLNHEGMNVVNTDQQIQCFYKGRDLKCIQPEYQQQDHLATRASLQRSTHKNTNTHMDLDLPVWATVVGIGPPKSGSTQFIQLLASHQNVSMGFKNGSAMELAFFNRDFSEGGLSRYQSYFQREEGIIHYVEKTPAYAFSKDAPYMMRTFLHKQLKLVYTIRDAAEEDLSWYMHQRRSVIKKLNYGMWVKKRIKAWKMQQACRDKAFHSFLLPTSRATPKSIHVLDDLFNELHFDWFTSYLIERHMRFECSSKAITSSPKKLKFANHFASEYDIKFGSAVEMDHYTNLRRYVHVFSRESIICVRDTDLHSTDRRAKTMSRVAEFLDLNQKGWPKSVETGSNEQSFRSSALQRLIYDQSVNFNIAENSTVRSLSLMQAFISNTLMSPVKAKWVNKICGFKE